MTYIYHSKVQPTSKILTATLVFIYFLAAILLLIPKEAQRRPAKNNFSKPSYNLQAINTIDLFEMSNKQIEKN